MTTTEKPNENEAATAPLADANRTKSKSQNRRRAAQPNSPSNGYHFKTAGMIFGDLEPVRYDKSIDPPIKACFNCWSLEHKRKDCTEPTAFDYCCNCGRKGLSVDVCPRCAKAFQVLREDLKRWIYDTFSKCKTSIRRDNDACCKTHAETKFNSCKDNDFGWQSKNYHSCTTVYAEPNDLFAYLREKKIMDEFEADRINNVPVNLDDTRMAGRDSLGENSIILSDAGSKMKNAEEPRRLTGEPIEDFLKLIDAVKHLPVKTQDVVILQFMSERKKQVAEDEMQSVKKVV